jgi:Ca2+-binding RTX toxin-like protein
MTDVESIMGGSGNDLLTGNTGGNYLSGGAGNDTLVGDLGNDILVGGSGVDNMYGNDGADALFALDGEIDVVDGGPGSDSAQTDPAEGAPVPGEDAIIPAPSEPVSTFVGPVYAPVFSSRQITKRPAPARRPGTQATVSSDQVLAPASPVPGGPGGFAGDAPIGVEQPITQSLIDQLGTQMAPYTFGQVIVTRRYQGQVTIGGTSGNDDIVIQRVIGPVGPMVDIFVNGGVTRYALPTPTLTLANKTGQDVLSILGDGEVDATLAPSSELPNQGQITFGSHQILYGQPGVLSPELNFSRLFEFTLITPQAADLIQLGVDPTNPNSQATSISGYSGQFALPAVQLTRVSQLHLDIATNERGGGVDDQILVNNLPQDAPELFLTTLKYPSGSGGGKDRLVVNGAVELANNPVEYEGVTPANLNVEVQSGGSIRFLESKTELASLNLAAGAHATIAPGDHALFVHRLDMVTGGAAGGGSFLDLTDGSLIVDHDGSAAAANFVRQLILNAYNPSAPTHWNSPGITSSFAATNGATGLGYAESSALLGPNGGNFRGFNRVDGTASLVSFTLLGDANLDRAVNFKDLVAMAQNYQLNPGFAVWMRGDFNYDGNTDFTDLVLMAQNYNQRLFT